MRISDWSSDVCSSDLLDRWRGEANDYFDCTAIEARKAFLHRFVVAGAAVRYRAIHPRQTAGIVALDIALRRNDATWFETLPADLDAALVQQIYYGHSIGSASCRERV